MTTKNSTKNTSKGDRYAFAWSRIRAASRAGFHLEAVTICESVMSDRMFAFLLSVGEKVSEKDPFAQLISKSKKRLGCVEMSCRSTMSWNAAQSEISSPDLFGEIDAWRRKRNHLIHGVAKSAPGTAMSPSAEFANAAQEAARHGETLARLLLRWHERERRHARSKIVRRPGSLAAGPR